MLFIYYIHQPLFNHSIQFSNNKFQKMDKNYYETLNLKRNATQPQIADSYRRLSLVWNPKNSKESKQTAQYHFDQVCEAYEVLSDPVKRAFYDKHGWRKLTCELYQDAGLKGGYKYGNNSQEIFDKFFSSTDALDQVMDRSIDNKESLFTHAFGGLYYKDQIQRPELVVEVPCTLNQLYKGAAKTASFDKKALNADGRSLSVKHQQKLLQIKPGFSKETVLRFKEQGNETIEHKTSDLVFKITEVPHENYTRSGNNLIYSCKINLIEALNCQPLQIVTLDGRKLRVSLDQIPNPQCLKEIQGEGMPILGSNKKGSLYIKFDIKFPKLLSQETKAELRALLKQ